MIQRVPATLAYGAPNRPKTLNLLAAVCNKLLTVFFIFVDNVYTFADTYIFADTLHSSAVTTFPKAVKKPSFSVTTANFKIRR